MFVDALPAGSQANLALLSGTSLADPFYLAGGTAAALYLGHRISVDLDFFGPDPFDSGLLAGQLADLGQFRLDRIAPDTLLGELAGVKINFFRFVKSLAYFADAELDPPPRMLVDFSWDKVKRFLEQEAKSLLKTL